MVKSLTSVTLVFLANNRAIDSDVYITLITPIAVVPKKCCPFERLFCKILSYFIHKQPLPKDSTTEIFYYVIKVTKIVMEVIFECILNVRLSFEYHEAAAMFRARK